MTPGRRRTRCGSALQRRHGRGRGATVRAGSRRWQSQLVSTSVAAPCGLLVLRRGGRSAGRGPTEAGCPRPTCAPPRVAAGPRREIAAGVSTDRCVGISVVRLPIAPVGPDWGTGASKQRRSWLREGRAHRAARPRSPRARSTAGTVLTHAARTRRARGVLSAGAAPASRRGGRPGEQAQRSRGNLRITCCWRRMSCSCAWSIGRCSAATSDIDGRTRCRSSRRATCLTAQPAEQQAVAGRVDEVARGHVQHHLPAGDQPGGPARTSAARSTSTSAGSGACSTDTCRSAS